MKVYIVIKLDKKTKQPAGMEVFHTEQSAAFYTYSNACRDFWCNIVEKEVRK